MADTSVFQEVFDELSADGAIGDPDGAPAYCYLRVSSSGQAEEGHSGLPRQIVHIHDVASESGYRIPWDLVFADDYSGFEFEKRPELSRLRTVYRKTNRQAHAVVIESLDRLSRNADWHQGFLLDEMTEYGLKVVFWKSFSSRIERAVIGAISQEGMEEAKRRMAEGNILKARDGRITARTPAYGYKFVDSNGHEGADAKKDTHYAVRDDEAMVISQIFSKVGLEGCATRSLAAWLEDRYPPPKQSAHWEPAQISLFIRNPVYKGEYAAHRYTYVKVPRKGQLPGEPVDLISKKIERPRNEWIIVPVPPIVSPDLWRMANRSLDKNAQMGRRNAKDPYLLTGLVKCSTCGYSYVGGRKRYRRKDGTETITRFYRCSSRANRPKHVVDDIGCTQPQILCQQVDDAVWSILCELLLSPEVLIDHLDRIMQQGENEQNRRQITLLERQIAERDREDQKIYKAYLADAFSENEFAVRRRRLKDIRSSLVEELEELRIWELTEEDLEERKRLILAVAENARKSGLATDAPFEIKQQIIKLLVDKVMLNAEEGWLQIEGIAPSRTPINTPIANGPAHAVIMGTTATPAHAR